MLKQFYIIAVFLVLSLVFLPRANAGNIFVTYQNNVAHFTNEPICSQSKIFLVSGRPSYQKIGQVPFAAEINQAALKSGVEPGFVAAVIKAESNFNPKAVSKKGATGLMQLMPHTAKKYNLKNPFDIWGNISAGVNQLKNLLGFYKGDKKLALAAYNAGHNAVKKYSGVPPYPETQNYIAQVFNYYKKINQSLETRDFFTEEQIAPKIPSVKIYKFVDRTGEIIFTNLPRQKS